MDQGETGPPAEDLVTGEPVTTRDRLWGWVVVVGVTVAAVAGGIWILANVFFGPCCTRPAPGY